MGRYAASRRRGGGLPRAAAAFPLEPPSLIDFDILGIEDFGGSVQVGYVSGAPPGIDAVMVRYRGTITGGVWFESYFLIAAGQVITATGSSGTTVEVQVAWAIDVAQQQSDWSASAMTPVP